MASYPIKMLKDEESIPFVPLCSTEGIVDPEGLTLDEKLATKLGPDNLLAGDNVVITTQDKDCYIAVSLPSGLALINNLTTETSGEGSLDAYQGYLLKSMIPEVVNNLTTVSTDKALSAYQGYLLDNKFNDYMLSSDFTSSNIISKLSGQAISCASLTTTGDAKIGGALYVNGVKTIWYE